jgi:AcrR family transcriptional regulator
MRSHENENKSSHIIHAAQSIFAEHGYKKVTMDDVARKLDIARSGLYHYFKNKEELFAAVLEHELMLYARDLDILIEQAETTEEKISAFGMTLVGFRRKCINMYRISHDDVSMNYDMVNKVRMKIRSFHNDTIMKILKSDRNVAHIPNIKAVSNLLTRALRGVVLNSEDRNDNRLQNDIIYLCRIFYYGLCAMPPE